MYERSVVGDDRDHNDTHTQSGVHDIVIIAGSAGSIECGGIFADWVARDDTERPGCVSSGGVYVDEHSVCASAITDIGFFRRDHRLQDGGAMSVSINSAARGKRNE
jgi:hypothetical protein